MNEQPRSSPPRSAYIHVPFCRHRCHFCAFLITTHDDRLRDWVDAVVLEADLRCRDWQKIFFPQKSTAKIDYRRLAITADDWIVLPKMPRHNKLKHWLK